MNSLSMMLRVVVAAAIVLSTACGVIKDRSNEYLDAEEGRAVVIPEWYQSKGVQARYPVPEITQQRPLAKKFVVPGPPDGTAALGNDPFLVESVAGESWLHLYTAPGKVWPLLDFYWREKGIETAYENISSGFLVSKPVSAARVREIFSLDPNLNLPPSLQMQAKLGQGVRRNTAELQVRLIPAVQNSVVNQWQDYQWQAADAKPELEQQILERIGQYVTSEAIENRYSLLANDIGGESLVRLLEDEAGLSFIEMQLSFQRAWSEVEQAINAAEIIVADQDRSERVFYISYLNESELSGWLPFVDEDAKRKEQNIALELFVDEDGVVLVRARPIAKGWTTEQAQRLLTLLFEHVS